MAAGQNENTNDGMMYALFFIVFLGAIWFFFGHQLSIAYLYSKRAEYYLLKVTLIDKLFPAAWELRVTPIEPLVLGLTNEPITLGKLGAVGSGIGFFSRWYYAVGFCFVGYKVLLKNPLQKFRRMHNMKSLVDSEQRMWPAIAPVAGLDLINQDIDKGPWSMSRKPLDFARYYKLLDEGNKLNRDRSEKLFAMQLGKLWEGSSKLPPYARALFACFAAQTCGDIRGPKKGWIPWL